MADFRCAEKSKAVGPWKTDGSASATEQEASSLEGMLLVRTKKSYVPRKCAQAALLSVCVGGLTHSPHGSRCVFVRLGPRSRVGILRSVDLRNGRNHPMQARCRSARQTTKTGQFGRGSGPLRLLSFALRFLRQPSRPKPPDAGDRPTGHCAWRSGAIVCFSAALIRACRSQGDIN